MANGNLLEWAQVKGLEVRDGTALLAANGYLITYGASSGGSSAGMGVTVPLRGDSWGKEQTKALRQALGKAGTAGYTNGIFQVNVSAFSKKGYVEKLEQVTQVLLNELPRLGAQPADICKYCGEGMCDDTVLENTIYFPAHTRCKEQKADKLLAEIEENQEHGNILLGIAGAILGGVIGSIPTFITAHFFDTIFSLLFALIPVASYFGYKKLKGLMGAAVPFIISIISLLCTVALVCTYQFTAILQLFAEEGVNFEEAGITRMDIFRFLFSEEFRGDMLASLVQPVIFCLIGIFVAWGYISRNNKHKEQQAKQLTNR